MKSSIDEQRVAIEAIATLVNVKTVMAELLLKPAGVPSELFQPLLNRRSAETGQPLSKREIAPILIDTLVKQPDGAGIVRAIVEIAAKWHAFHLAHDEYAARATVQKAQAVLGQIQDVEARAAQERSEDERKKHERELTEFRRQRELLLQMYEELAGHSDPHQRGYLLQELLDLTFRLYGVPVVRSFQRNAGAEQIDGAFKLEGWHYLVECRWRQKLADIRELDGLKGQVDRSGKQTMGFFLCINGWSEHVPALLKQNPEKSIILMDGYDLYCVLQGTVDLCDLILAKVQRLNLEGEVFHGIREYLEAQSKRPTG
jgi:hypothetical protein